MCNTVLPATHTQTISAFTPQPQGITVLWLVLVPTYKGMARLSWPGWPVTYQDKCPVHWELNRDTVTHPITNRTRCRLTLLIETNALSLCQITTTSVKTCVLIYKLNNKEMKLLNYMCGRFQKLSSVAGLHILDFQLFHIVGV